MSNPTVTVDEQSLRDAYEAQKGQCDVAGAVFRVLSADSRAAKAMSDYRERLEREAARHRVNSEELRRELEDIQENCPHHSVTVAENKLVITDQRPRYSDHYDYNTVAAGFFDISTCSLCGKEISRLSSPIRYHPIV